MGSLMCAAMGTRPDIAFATSTIAQYSENPGWQHWEAVKRIFHYLLGMKKMELTYGGEERGLVGYVDADGASQDHRQAISGYIFMVDRGAISWSSKKQKLVTLSTTEAEYIAATHAAKEAISHSQNYLTPSIPPPLYSGTVNLLSLSLMMVITMLERNTSISVIILFDISLKQVQLS